jgi:succinate dehydrogenase/fumarate reductase flavoprotein subunit
MRNTLRLLALAPFAAALSAAEPGLIVVGAGIAGLSAALEAARLGVAVTVIEQNSVFGGHAVISSGGLCLIGTPLQERLKIADSLELAQRDFETWGEDPDPEWVRYYVKNSKTEIHDWMTALGTEFMNVSLNGAGNSVPRFHSPRGQGIGLVVPIERGILSQGGVTFLFNTRVTGLEMKGARVTGVATRNLRTGASGRLSGRTVLISTGGFAANLDLVRASWPATMRVPERVLVGGGFFALGGGMDLVKKAGGVSARLDHQWNYETGLPDPFDPEGKRGFFSSASGAIWVNAQGKRFALEQHEPKTAIPVIAAQVPARFWAIFDAEGRRGFRVVHAGFSRDRVEELFDAPEFIPRGATIEELAKAAGLPAETLRTTVERYNAMVDAGADTDFGRFGPGRARPRGFAPPVRKIAQPPFYAAPMYILIRKSLGGISVDARCRVLTADGKPIEGLFAAGEATGFGGINGKNGLEGTFLGPSILMGRVAAQTVAAELKTRPAAPVSAAVRTTPPAVKPELAAACLGCHDIPKLISKERPGYWHFERAHRIVLSRGLNCTGCHAEIAPFRAAAHKIDRELQTAVCQHCHVNPPFAGRRGVGPPE